MSGRASPVGLPAVGLPHGKRAMEDPSGLEVERHRTRDGELASPFAPSSSPTVSAGHLRA